MLSYYVYYPAFRVHKFNKVLSIPLKSFLIMQFYLVFSDFIFKSLQRCAKYLIALFNGDLTTFYRKM